MNYVVSPRVKFIVITVDELVLVPIAMAIVYFFAPEWLLLISVLLIIGAAIFVLGKYYLVYPSLLNTPSHALYELKGMKAVVVDSVTSASGKIRVGSEIWDARCKDGLEISAGTEVKILDRVSFRVLVGPLNPEESLF